MALLLDPRELALLRGWMNHLGWPLLGQLYLDGADIAASREAVSGLRRRLALRARQSGRPALEAFWLAERKAGAAWLGQAEAGLAELLDAPAPAPAPDDPVGRWLADGPARKLQAAGVATLGDLAGWCRERGRGWRKGLGAAAREVEAFLRLHGHCLGCAGGALETPGPKPAPGNRVLEDLFAARPDLGGAEGSNRAAQARCRIQARNDFEAVQAWLGLRDPASHTYRSYRKEAERFLLWAVSERGKPLSSLDTADCKAYRDFLFAPPARWLNPDFKPRWSPHWRPFKGPLQVRTVRLVETVLSALCEWLVRQRYLDANPFDGLPPLPGEARAGILVEHALDDRQWQWLLDYCEGCLADPPAGRDARHYQRLWIALQLAYCTGLRLAELAAARFGDIVHKTRGGGQYWLRVTGKGGKRREVPVPGALAEALRRYAYSRGVAFGVPDSPEPLIGKFRKASAGFGEPDVEAPFSASGLHVVLRRFFKEAAAARQAAGGGEEGERDARALARMTTHWLRHTHATHALGRGAGLLLVKENLGHASLATTSVYLHGDRDLRHEAMERLFRKPA
jgi:integrase